MTVHFAIAVRRDTQDPEQIVCRIRKAWWGGPGRGVESRQVAEAWVSVAGMNEGEAAAAALLEAASLIADRHYKL